MNSGIYTITSPSGSLYIGSALNYKKRWATHRSDLRKGAHHNVPLQAAHDKYGMAALVFELVLPCPPEELLENEQRIIDSYPREFIYNTAYVAGSRARVPQSIETRRKMSATRKGRKAAPETLARLSESKWNIKKPSNQSGFCGVSVYRHKWAANATVNGKRHYIGVFDTVQEAYAARQVFLKLRGLLTD